MTSAGLFAVAILSAAQAAPATTGQTAGKVVSAQQSRVVMANYVNCLVRTGGYKLKPVLTMPAGRASDQILIRHTGGTCLAKAVTPLDVQGNEFALKFQPSMMRGALYEYYYRKEFGQNATPKLDDAPKVAYEYSDTAPDTVAYQRGMIVGDCAVRTDTTAAHRLLWTEVGSAEEKKAAADLAPAFGKCLSQGASFELSLSSIRTISAEALYRLSVAKRDRGNA